MIGLCFLVAVIALTFIFCRRRHQRYCDDDHRDDSFELLMILPPAIGLLGAVLIWLGDLMSWPIALSSAAATHWTYSLMMAAVISLIINISFALFGGKNAPGW